METVCSCFVCPDHVLLLKHVPSTRIKATRFGSNVVQEQVPTINRDAVAAVLGRVDAGPVQQAVVIDVRRHDELSLYGSIPGIAAAEFGLHASMLEA